MAEVIDSTVDDAEPAAQGGVAAVPRPAFRLIYGQKDITTDLVPYVTSVTYTDNLSGQSDEIDVELEDVDGRWINAWYPGKGDTLTLKIGYEDEPLLVCGQFEIDEIEFNDPPSTVSMRALGSFPGKPVRTRKSIGMENTTLAAVAQHIAKRNGLTLTGKIRHTPIDRVTQYSETDVVFLSRLADEYGYAFKVAGNRLIFTEIVALLSADPSAVLQVTDLESIRITDKISFVYRTSQVKYQDIKKKALVVYGTKEDGQVGQVGKNTSSDTLKKTAKVKDKATAQVKADAGLNKARLEQVTGSVTIPGNPAIVAGLMIGIEGLGKLSGKYLVQCARHQIDRGGGYTTELDIARESAVVVVSDGNGGNAKKPAAAKKSTSPGQLKVYGVDKTTGNVGVVGTSAKK
jgi:phage protein D